MTSLALKSLETLRRLFEAESIRGHWPVQHVLVVYPEYDLARDFQTRDGSLSLWPLSLRPDAPWPPAHAIRLSSEALREAAGFLAVPRGAWRGGFYGDVAAFDCLSALARDAGRTFRAATADTPEVKERLWMSGALCLDDPADLWLTVVHQLGWKPLPGSPLRWDRFTWDDHRAWPLSRSRRRRVRRSVLMRRRGRTPPPGAADALPQMVPVLLESPPEPRPWHYSIAGPDLFRASAFAIDAILSLLTQAPRPPAQSSGYGATPAPLVVQALDTSPPAPSESAKAKRRRERYHWVTRFLGLALEHPDWPVPRLAAEAGTTAPTVYRAKDKLEKVRAVLEARRMGRGATRAGFRHAQSGTIEAIDASE